MTLKVFTLSSTHLHTCDTSKTVRDLDVTRLRDWIADRKWHMQMHCAIYFMYWVHLCLFFQLSFFDRVRHLWFYTHLHAYMCLCPLFPVSLPPFLTLSSVLVPWDCQCFPLIPLFYNSSFPCPVPPSLLYSNNPSSPASFL